MDDRSLRLWGDKRYHSWNYHLRQRFGEKVSKVPLNGGMTCPNRDGKLGTGGCIFCGEGSGHYAGRGEDDLRTQFEQVTERVRKKWPHSKYIAYFQAFSNTYAPVPRLREMFEEILTQKGVVGLSLATRPDCLPNEVLDLLSEINERTYLWVELGLQSIHDRTLSLINRGHDFATFMKGMEKLAARKLRTCVHIIFGLPGERDEDMMATAQSVAGMPVQGIKLHSLHLMQGTPMEKMYREGGLEFLERDDYIRLVADTLELLPPEMVIHRLTGDAPRELLIGPRWILKKWEVLQGIERELERRNSWQGRYWNRPSV